MNKEELIGRILAATPEQLKTVERALSGEKAVEVTDTRLLIDGVMRVGWRRPINPTKSRGTACKAAVLLII